MPTRPGGPVAVDARPWYAANELLAFLLELAALSCLGWWGFTVGGTPATAALLGLGLPLAAVVLWALFAAPRARLRPRLPVVLVVKAVVLGGGAAALYGVGHHLAGAAGAVVVVANTALAESFRRPPAAAPGSPRRRPAA
ncbi:MULTISPECIES: YrdB family protein [unclassified Streptomyces]|uniref:YrdB family protein n=1 Tax=unclassified Streptomyces TaxID=2593676 RepID=UPI0036F55B39